MKIEISDSFAATAAELSALFASAELTAARVQAIRTHSASFANYSFSQIKNTDGAITKTLFQLLYPQAMCLPGFKCCSRTEYS
ncbi:hypothetical protein RQN30_10390 [Arcanobacterium hippocoleae]